MPGIAHLRGSIVGAAILTLFGSVWCILALVSWAARPSWSPGACIAITLALVSLCGQRLMALRSIPSIDDPVAAAKGKRTGIFFGIIFGIEGGLIALCSILLARFGLDSWIPTMTAVIVGVHFLPLARLFEVPLYYGTGAVIVIAMGGCALIQDAFTRELCAGLVMAAVLWLTALIVLVQARPARAS
jgi:hypothetical protein